MKKLTIYAISFLTAFQMAPVFVLAQEAVAPTKETSATKSVAEEVKEKRDAIRQEIKSGRDAIKKEVIEKRDTVKQEIQQKREAVKGGIKEVKDAVRNELQMKRENAAGATKEVREAVQGEIKERREALNAELKVRREALETEFKAKREALKEDVKQKREEFKEKATERKDELKKKLGEKRAAEIEKYFNAMVRKFEAALDQLQKLGDRISARLDTAEANGKEVTALRESLVKARTAINDAEQAFESAKAEYAKAAASTDVKGAFANVREVVQGVATKIRSAHAALVDVVNSIKGLGGGTAEKTPAVVAPSSESVAPAPTQ